MAAKVLRLNLTAAQVGLLQGSLETKIAAFERALALEPGHPSARETLDGLRALRAEIEAAWGRLVARRLNDAGAAHG